jgi:putative transposase
MNNYFVRRITIGKSPTIDALARECGALYSKTVVFFWRVVRKKGLWLKPSSVMRYLNSEKLHAHTADATVQAFFGSLHSWRKRRKSDSGAKPPRRRRRFFRVEYKNSAIRLREGKLLLSNGRLTPPVILPWPFLEPRTLTLHWTGTEYEALAVYKAPEPEKAKGTKVAGIDLGEKHIAASHDSERCYLLNGRFLRSKRQYQNKLKAHLQSLLDTKKKGSRRYKKLQKSKKKQRRKLENQIRDIEHKQTTRLVSTLHEDGVQTVVIGDVRNIRKRIDYGKKANQKLHQWAAGRARFYLSYKARRRGMKVELQNEAYTSQECPACNQRHKPNGRRYRCKSCGFRYHRDGVGGFNIRKKYLGQGTVVGVMAPPIGLRYTPHARCSSRNTLREAAAL